METRTVLKSVTYIHTYVHASHFLLLSILLVLYVRKDKVQTNALPISWQGHKNVGSFCSAKAHNFLAKDITVIDFVSSVELLT